LVFVTKYRRRCITARVAAILEQHFKRTCFSLGVILEEIGWERDHVHLLVSYPPRLSVSSLVHSLKGASSRRVRAQNLEEVAGVLWGRSFWSPSYCVVSCGGAPLDIIRKYIEGQPGPVSSPA